MSIKNCPIIQTPDGYFRLIDRQAGLLSSGFSTFEAMQRNAHNIRDDESATLLQRRTYAEFFNPSALAEIDAETRKIEMNKATKVALLKLGEALLACEAAGITIKAQGMRGDEYLTIEQGPPGKVGRTLWDGQEHAQQDYLDFAAVELALLAGGVKV